MQIESANNSQPNQGHKIFASMAQRAAFLSAQRRLNHQATNNQNQRGMNPSQQARFNAKKHTQASQAWPPSYPLAAAASAAGVPTTPRSGGGVQPSRSAEVAHPAHPTADRALPSQGDELTQAITRIGNDSFNRFLTLKTKVINRKTKNVEEFSKKLKKRYLFLLEKAARVAIANYALKFKDNKNRKAQYVATQDLAESAVNNAITAHHRKASDFERKINASLKLSLQHAVTKLLEGLYLSKFGN